jgi:hypothetical protein
VSRPLSGDLCSTQLLQFIHMALQALNHEYTRDDVHMDIKLSNFVRTEATDTAKSVAEHTNFDLALKDQTNIRG